MWQRLERKISFLCLFVYLFIFFLPFAFLVFSFLLFLLSAFFSIRIFPSAFSHPHPPSAGIRSAFYRHPLVTCFMEEMSYVFSFNFFFHCPLTFTLHWWPLAFPILSPSLQNFHVVPPTKKMSPLFLSLALDLYCPFSRWASLAYRLLSLFLSFSCSIFRICCNKRKKNLCITLWWKKKDNKRNTGNFKKTELKKFRSPPYLF